MSNRENALQTLRDAIMQSAALAVLNEAAFDEIAASADLSPSGGDPDKRVLTVPRRLFDALEVGLKIQVSLAEACWEPFGVIEVAGRKAAAGPLSPPSPAHPGRAGADAVEV